MTDLSLAIRISADAQAASAEMQRVATAVTQVGTAAKTAATGLGAVGPAVEVMRRQTQAATASMGNLVSQFNDIGVMVASGQSPLILAMQQGTQIAQALGNGTGGAGAAVRSLGAAFLGMLNPINLVVIAGVAAFAALAQGLIGLLGGAEETEDAVENLAEATKRYEAAAKQAGLSAEDLAKKFGAAAEAAREAFKAAANTEKVAETRAVAATLDSVVASLQRYVAEVREVARVDAGSPPALIAAAAEATRTNADAARQALALIRNELGLAGQDAEIFAFRAREFIDAIAAGGDGQRELAALQAILQRIPGGLENARQATVDLDAAFSGVRTTVVAVKPAVDEVTKATLGLNSILGDLPVSIREAANLAATLAKNFEAAATAASRAKASLLTRVEEARIRLANAGDPVRTAGALEEAEARRELTPFAGIPGETGAIEAQIAARRQLAEEAARLGAELSRIDSTSKAGAKEDDKATRERERAILDLGRALDRLAPSYERDAANAAAWRDERLKTLDATKEGYAAYAAEVGQVYDGMLAEAYRRDLDRRTDWAAGVERGLAEIGEKTVDFASTSEDAVKSISASLDENFKSFVTGAKTAGEVFTGLTDTILEQLARLASQQLLSPLTNSLFGLLGGVGPVPGAPGSAGGIVGGGSGILSLLGGLFGFAKGGVFDAPGVAAFRNEIVDSPTFFRFAKGGAIGVMGEEQGASEAVMPLRRDGAGRLGVDASGVGRSDRVTVNIINRASGTEARAEERNEGGSRIVDVIVDRVEERIGGNIARGVGPVPAALQSTYGLNRAGRAF